MNKTLSLVFGASILFSSAVSAVAVTILPPGSAWDYSTDGGATWNGPSLAPFGNTSGGDFGANTYWAAGTPMSVRTTVNLAGYDLSSIGYDLGVDNGFDLFVNGNHVAGDNAEGFTFRWEYSGAIPQSALLAGANLVEVVLEDHGGLTAFDMQITGDARVPDGGATLSLLVIGFSGLAFAARRRAC